MSAAIYYHPEAYTTSGPKLMGRNAAGESFLRGFIKHTKSSEFWVQVQNPDYAQKFISTLKAEGRTDPVRVVDMRHLSVLSKIGVVFYPGPGIGKHAYHRASIDHGGWSLCGITHTTSSAGAMDAIVDIITNPVESWDALICTSSAVKSNVERLLQAQVDYLQNRLGITKIVLPQLPVIPLGIHTKDFNFSAEQRVKARQSLGVDAQTRVVMFMGRLSFHAKSHPLAMYQALESARRQTHQPVVLVECGWYANEYIARAFDEAAKLVCPKIPRIILDGRMAENRETAWAGADIFCSFSDNIQETFGIVPIEAMASGLPVVVSDWDGYKDTVREGIDGFRIPTLMPGAGLGADLSIRHALEIDTYDMYCGHTCSLIAVDIPAATAAFSQLLDSPELCRKMGLSGQLRARKLYDWKAIINQYEALWSSLTEIRKRQANKKMPLPYPWPSRLDPFYGFDNYPTLVLHPKSILGLSDIDYETALARVKNYQNLTIVNYAKMVLPDQDIIDVILLAASKGYKTADALIAGIDDARKPFACRSLVWLVKLGILKLLDYYQ